MYISLSIYNKAKNTRRIKKKKKKEEMFVNESIQSETAVTRRLAMFIICTYVLCAEYLPTRAFNLVFYKKKIALPLNERHG
jgi:hypothetical protein